ncbi:MAG: T9SS type A sorting domain-containing protein [Bacteroidetes bacterium]|nr:T9SS type A sorting domain-containing protein [Bacteroidota bacterium]
MIKRILPSLLLALGLSTLSKAQLNYTVSFPTSTFTQITGTTPPLTLAYPPAQAAAEGVDAFDEGAANNITIPFSFNFNGLNYTKCHISTNGFIALGSQALDTLNVFWANNLATGPFNGTNNDSRASRPIIAPLWDDMWGVGTGTTSARANYIRYTTTGTAPNRVFTIQWLNAQWTWTGTAAAISFQTRLYETTNVIEFVYRQQAGAAAGAGASIGLADVFTGSGNFLSLSGVTNTATNSSTTETANIATKPASNFTIRFTPIPIPATDAGVRLIAAPVVSTCLTTPQSVTYTLKNSGTGTIAPGAATINLTLTGANTGSYSVSNTKTLAFNQFDTLTINNINLNNAGATTLTGLISLAGDGRKTNDTSKYTYSTAALVNTFPLNENCVAPTSVYKYSIGVAGGRNLWSNFNSASLTVPNNINPLVPIAGAPDNSYYAFLGRYSGFTTPDFTSILYTNCLQIPSGLASNQYNLSFYMTHDSAQSNSTSFSGDDSLYVVYSEDKGVTWNRITGGGFERMDVNLTDWTWTNHTVDLSSLAGKTVQLGFEGVSQMGNLFAIDSITIEANPPLPIKLTTFTGKKEGAKNLLSWETANEQNNKGFELQRGVDGKEFKAIAFVNSKATNGNSSTALNYNYIDEKPSTANNYYRLRQVDINGKESFSNVVLIKSIQNTKAEITAVYPNPAKENINVVLNSVSAEKLTVRITDLSGRIIVVKNIETTSGDNNFKFNTANFANGTYTIKVTTSNNVEVATQKFVKM